MFTLRALGTVFPHPLISYPNYSSRPCLKKVDYCRVRMIFSNQPSALAAHKQLSPARIGIATGHSAQYQARLSWIWGGLFSSLYFLYQYSSPSDVHAEEPKPRGLPIEHLPINTRPIDMEAWGFVPDENRPGWYQMKAYPNNPFRVRSEGTCLLWRSTGTIIACHVKEVAERYQMLSQSRSLVVQTGGHGSDTGEFTPTPDTDNPNEPVNSAKFTVEDLKMMEHYPNVGIFVPITKNNLRPVLKIHEVEGLDLIDAWCFSIEQQSYKRKANLLDVSTVIRALSHAEFLDHPSHLDNSTQYMPLGDLQKNATHCLQEHGLCYIHGTGGMGKSRVSREIERVLREKNEVYLGSTYIALKSTPHIQNFYDFVKEAMGNATLVAKYFEKIKQTARENHKKWLVVVDNIDDENQYQEFRKIFNDIGIDQHTSNNPIQLILTGRRNISDWMGPTSDRCTVEIDTYSTPEECWKLFRHEFIPSITDNTFRADAEQEVHQYKEKLIEIFKQYKNHVGLTLVLAKHFAREYTLCHQLNTLDHLEKDFPDLLASKEFGDYDPLDEIHHQLIKNLDKNTAFKGYVERVYRSISLLIGTGSQVDYNMIEAFLLANPTTKTAGAVLCKKIINELISCGHLTLSADRLIGAPEFIGRIALNQLSSEYKEKQGEINEIIHTAIEVLSNREGARNRDIDVFLGLIGFTEKLGGDALLGQKVCEEAGRFLSTRFTKLELKEVQGRYKWLMEKISKNPNFSMDPILFAWLTGKRPPIPKDDKQQNNCQLLFPTSEGCESPAIAPNDQMIFLSIAFKPMLKEDWSKAEAWKQAPSCCKNNIADFSSMEKSYPGDGLRSLIWYLFEDKKVSVIDLSDNQIGERPSGSMELQPLLGYLGSLRSLDLSQNKLHMPAGKEVLDCLRQNKTLEHIKLSNNELNDDDIVGLCDALGSHPSIQTIELDGNCFGSSGLEALLKFIQDKKHIQKITIEKDGLKCIERHDQEIIFWTKEAETWQRSRPCMGGKANFSHMGKDYPRGGMNGLVRYLKHNEVSHINLSGNNLGYRLEELEELSSVLKLLPSVRTLDLSQNNLRDLHALAGMPVLNYLKQNETLEHIKLSNNDLKDADIISLCYALRAHPSIQKIELDGNFFGFSSREALQKRNTEFDDHFFCFSGLEALQKLMKGNPVIQQITLEQGDFKRLERHGQEIIFWTHKAEKWKELRPCVGGKADFSHMGKDYPGEGMYGLMRYLFAESQISHINLSGNNLGSRENGEKELYPLLKLQSSLKTLDLSQNNLYGPVGKKILSLLQDNKTLECVKLSGNYLDDRSIQDVCHALRQHPSIQRVELHWNSFDKLEELEQLMKDNEHIQVITVERSHYYPFRHGDTKRLERQGSQIVRCTS